MLKQHFRLVMILSPNCDEQIAANVGKLARKKLMQCVYCHQHYRGKMHFIQQKPHSRKFHRTFVYELRTKNNQMVRMYDAPSIELWTAKKKL
jgi:hypothetical protein